MPQEADNMPGTLWMFHAEGLLCGVMRLGGYHGALNRTASSTDFL